MSKLYCLEEYRNLTLAVEIYCDSLGGHFYEGIVYISNPNEHVYCAKGSTGEGTLGKLKEWVGGL